MYRTILCFKVTQNEYMCAHTTCALAPHQSYSGVWLLVYLPGAAKLIPSDMAYAHDHLTIETE